MIRVRKMFCTTSLVFGFVAACMYYAAALTADETFYTNKVIVDTTSGAVRGETLSLFDGKAFQQFLSVRYAEPPVNELRYRAPQPAKRRTGIADGTYNPKNLPTVCPQPIGLSDMLIPKDAPYKLEPLAEQLNEDCLHCHFYRPLVDHARQQQQRALLPVLIYIHGGSFISGSNSNELFNGSRLAVETNTLVVVCNYRVSIFGFLKLDVPGIIGNQGLKDQALAIKFVRDNAEQFGGNPRQITVFGESAGGASVHYQLLSSKSRDVFTRGVALSGEANAPFAYAPPEAVKQIYRRCIHDGMRANLSLTDPMADKKLFDFLQSKSWQEINQVIFRLGQNFATSSLCTPVPTIDGEFITKSPTEMMMTGDFKLAPAIHGRTANEAQGLLPFLVGELVFKQLPDIKINSFLLELILGSVVKASASPTNNATVQSVLQAYGTKLKVPAANDNSDDAGRARWSLGVAAVSDSLFFKPLRLVIDAYVRQNVPVYQYVFDHKPSVPTNGVSMGNGVGHFDDVPFWFGAPLNPKYGHTKAEAELSLRMMHALGNFARTGNPNSGGFNSSATAHCGIHQCGRLWQPVNDKSIDDGFVFKT